MNQAGPRAATAERARWLAELALAVDQAQQLAWRLRASEANTAEVEGLYRRLEAARIEVEALRRGGWRTSAVDIGPVWTSLLDWTGQAN